MLSWQIFVERFQKGIGVIWYDGLVFSKSRLGVLSNGVQVIHWLGACFQMIQLGKFSRWLGLRRLASGVGCFQDWLLRTGLQRYLECVHGMRFYDLSFSGLFSNFWSGTGCVCLMGQRWGCSAGGFHYIFGGFYPTTRWCVRRPF